MKLGRLLELHQQTQPLNTLPKNLGDGYLLKYNSIYQIIRTQAQQLGYTFTTDVGEDYLALPLSQLDTFLKLKTVPYCDNVSVLKKIEGNSPNETIWDEVVDNIKKNHLFHESCHAIAREESTRYFKNDLTETDKILKILIEESFSNSCELLSNSDIHDTVHRVFFEINSYIFVYEERFQLKKVIDELGGSKALAFLVFCYLHSNFLHEKMSDSAIDRVCRLLKIPKSKALKPISKIAFQLNPRFRLLTTIFYLRLCGFKYTTSELHRIDFMSLVENDSQFLIYIDRLTKPFSTNKST